MWKPIPEIGVGASYRSKIKVDYEGRRRSRSGSTGNPVFDAARRRAAAASASIPVTTSIDFPGVAQPRRRHRPGRRASPSSLEADWTEWSSFKALNITFPDGAVPRPRPRRRTGRTPGRTASASRRSSATGRCASATTTTTRRSPTQDVGPDPRRQRPQRLHGRLRLQHADRWGVDVGGAATSSSRTGTVLTRIARQFLRHLLGDGLGRCRATCGSRSKRGGEP